MNFELPWSHWLRSDRWSFFGYVSACFHLRFQDLFRLTRDILIDDHAFASIFLRLILFSWIFSLVSCRYLFLTFRGLLKPGFLNYWVRFNNRRRFLIFICQSAPSLLFHTILSEIAAWVSPSMKLICFLFNSWDIGKSWRYDLILRFIELYYGQIALNLISNFGWDGYLGVYWWKL